MEMVAVNKALRASWKQDIQVRRHRYIEDAVRKGRSLKKAMNRSTIGQKGILPLKDAAGRVCESSEEQQKVVQTFFNDLYRSHAVIPENVPDQEEDFLPFLRSEVLSALKPTKNGTSPGIDGITSDALKAGAELLATPLANIFSQCVNDEFIPDHFADSKTILLHKKGDPRLIGNYRPISLLPTIGKLFTKSINRRLQANIEAQQAEEQFGFRRGRSTIDAIHVLSLLISNCQEYNMPFYMVFIDIQKAFDSVETNAFINSFANHGEDRALALSVRTLYRSASSFVVVNKAEVEIDVKRGVRQRDSLSPTLFNCAFKDVFRTLDWEEKGFNINGVRLNHLRFADDVVLISKDASELQEMLQELNDKLRAVGLLIHPEKTKAMTNMEQQPPLTLQGRGVRRKFRLPRPDVE